MSAICWQESWTGERTIMVLSPVAVSTKTTPNLQPLTVSARLEDETVISFSVLIRAALGRDRSALQKWLAGYIPGRDDGPPNLE